MSQAGSLIAGAGGGREGDVVRMEVGEVGEAVMGDGLEAGLGAILGIVRRLWDTADCGMLRAVGACGVGTGEVTIGGWRYIYVYISGWVGGSDRQR